MNKRIRVVILERNAEQVHLFERRLKDSETIQLEKIHVYNPFVLEEFTPEGVDIFLVDIYLPCDITRFIKETKRKFSTSKILMNCDFVQPDLIFHCLLSGANGFIEKYAPINKFEQAVKDCHKNLSFLPLSIFQLMLQRYAAMEKDLILKNIFNLFSKGFLLNDVVLQTGLNEEDIKRRIFLSHQR
jgi:DNA-binding NarL/FixJ family response regulator